MSYACSDDDLEADVDRKTFRLWQCDVGNFVANLEKVFSMQLTNSASLPDVSRLTLTRPLFNPVHASAAVLTRIGSTIINI